MNKIINMIILLLLICVTAGCQTQKQTEDRADSIHTEASTKAVQLVSTECTAEPEKKTEPVVKSEKGTESLEAELKQGSEEIEEPTKYDTNQKLQETQPTTSPETEPTAQPQETEPVASSENHDGMTDLG